MDRVNILHLSDLHIAGSNLYDSRIILRALFKDISQLSKTHLKPHLIVFSGDLVLSGDDNQAFEIALDEFIYPLLESTGLDSDSFVIAPGNHEVQRAVVRDAVQWHSVEAISSIKDRSTLNQIVTKDEFRATVAKKFGNYMDLWHTLKGDFCVREVPESASFFYPKLNLSVIVLNTACFSTGGLFHSDEGLLLVAERTLVEALEAVPGSARRIIVGHHPLSMLSEWCRPDIQRLLDFSDAYCFGHVHFANPRSERSMNGSAFYSQAGGLFTHRDRYNGYAILSLSQEKPHVEANYRTYFERRQEFDRATDLASNGRFFSSEEGRKFWQGHPERLNSARLLEWLESVARPAARSDFDDKLYERSLNEVFVEPTLSPVSESEAASKREYILRPSINLDKLVAYRKNYLFHAHREYGKTTTLKVFALRMLENVNQHSPVLPLYINFSDIKVGSQQILRSLRAALPGELPEGITLHMLLELGFMAILVDDVNPEKTRQFEQLRVFVETYPRRSILFVSIVRLPSWLGML